MSLSSVENLRTINGDIDMEVVGIHGHQENGPGEINNVSDGKGVATHKRDTTPQAPMEAAAGAQSSGALVQYNNKLGNTRGRKDTGKSKKSNCGKQKSVSSDLHDDNVDGSSKKRKTRRGKPNNRKLKPYIKQAPYERHRRRSIGRQLKLKSSQPPAPYNTTQFLMEDHSDLPDLEEKLAKTSTNADITTNPDAFQKPAAHPRTRDSSFSIDSDEDYFYSSPEDEEEFLTKEFSSAYEDLHAERLGALTKSELIEEYVQLEAKLDVLTKRMRSKTFHTDESDRKNDLEMAKKLKMYQQRVDDLMQQNETLRRENETLRGKDCFESSVDSESDSDSSSEHSGCSCNDNSGSSSSRFGGHNGDARISRSDSCDDDDGGEERSSGGVNGSASSQTILDIGGLPT